MWQFIFFTSAIARNRLVDVPISKFKLVIKIKNIRAFNLQVDASASNPMVIFQNQRLRRWSSIVNFLRAFLMYIPRLVTV